MEANLKPKPDHKLTREDREAAALRKNLGKRKQQGQARDIKNDISKDKE